ncbi:MAG: LPS export ABC transporter permease LptG [Alphaproteobacteria bacterium]|nr:LPS export ABC transporter permease LptG [Alphaproteobacteria bacterium]
MTRLQQHRLEVPVLLEYIAKTFLVRFLVLLFGIAVIMQALDVLSQSGDVLAPDGAGMASIWRFTMLRFPQMISNVVGFSALLATLITCTTLAQSSEIAVMQAAGLSSFRIIFPMMGVCAVAAVIHFAFNETIVAQSNDEFERWRASGFAVGDVQLPPSKSDAWAIEGNTRVRVQSVTRDGAILDKVTLYNLDSQDKIKEITSANFAAYTNGQWIMFDVTRFWVDQMKVQSMPRAIWDTKIPPARFKALSVDPETVPIGRLASAVSQLRGEGMSVNKLTAWLNHKISGPLGTILMPLLGAMAAFGVQRSGTMFLRVIGGMAFGFSYFIVDNLLLAIGQFGTIPPVLAAWSPLFLFLFLGASVLFYTEA